MLLIINLHDRTGRLENRRFFNSQTRNLHDRTGRLEIALLLTLGLSLLHDRTGRLEMLMLLCRIAPRPSRPHRSLRKFFSEGGRLVLNFTTAQVA